VKPFVAQILSDRRERMKTGTFIKFLIGVFAVMIVMPLCISCSEKTDTKKAPTARPAAKQEPRANSLERLFPEKALAGAVNSNFNGEQHPGKAVTGGILIEGRAIVQKDIRNDQIKPTAMAVLKGLKSKNPNVEWFHVFLTNDQRMVECSNWIAIAEYKEGKISIAGGLPTDEDIKEWNNSIGKPLLDYEGKPMDIINDNPRMRRPTEEDLQIAYDACITRRDIRREIEAKVDALRGQGRRADADKARNSWVMATQEKKDKIIAKRLGLPLKKMSDTANMVGFYYSRYAATTM
jgi:hypothetical protein